MLIGKEVYKNLYSKEFGGNIHSYKATSINPHLVAHCRKESFSVSQRIDNEDVQVLRSMNRKINKSYRKQNKIRGTFYSLKIISYS